MTGHTPLIATVVTGLGLAFVFGLLAQRLRIAPIAGYLLAGVVAGPFTPGFVADQRLAAELAEMGIILLMFGVGLHFSLTDLLRVRAVVIPGALLQVAATVLLGCLLGQALGWPLVQGLVLGLALSAASTVVLMRNLQERRLLQTERGHVAVGWLIIQDLVMVVALVLLPALAGLAETGAAAPVGRATYGLTAGLTIVKVAAFIALMLLVGRRVVPWLLHYVAHTGSRELFRLAVLAIALGIAFVAAELFDVSFALGAFFAGMAMSESPLSQRAAEESLPLRDAFAVLFFVSIGMLFDPTAIARHPGPVAAVLAIVMIGNPLAAYLVLRLLRQKPATRLTMAAGVAQIGEFSVILANLGIALGLLPPAARDLILAAVLISILLNPLAFRLAERLYAQPAPAGEQPAPAPATEEKLLPTRLAGHAVLVGFGRVGGVIAAELKRRAIPFLVIEDNAALVEKARAEGLEALAGNGAAAALLAAANIAGARLLFIAIPDGFEAGQILAQARAANPGLAIVARAHSDAEFEHFRHHGADFVVMGEREIAREMLARGLGGETAPNTLPA